MNPKVYIKPTNLGKLWEVHIYGRECNMNDLVQADAAPM